MKSSSSRTDVSNPSEEKAFKVLIRVEAISCGGTLSLNSLTNSS